MAQVTREAFDRLSSGAGLKIIKSAILESAPEIQSVTDVGELIDGGILSIGDTLIPADLEIKIEAEVTEDRLLRVGEQEFDSIDVAAHELGASNLTGIEFWQLEVNGEPITIAEVIVRKKERVNA